MKKYLIAGAVIAALIYGSAIYKLHATSAKKLPDGMGQ